jgi:hypothetical protein
MYGLTSALATEASKSTASMVDSNKDVTMVASRIVGQITRCRSECKDNVEDTLTAAVIRTSQDNQLPHYDPGNGTWLLTEDDCIGQAVGYGGFVYNHINLYDVPPSG